MPTHSACCEKASCALRTVLNPHSKKIIHFTYRITGDSKRRATPTYTGAKLPVPKSCVLG